MCVVDVIRQHHFLHGEICFFSRSIDSLNVITAVYYIYVCASFQHLHIPLFLPLPSPPSCPLYPFRIAS